MSHEGTPAAELARFEREGGPSALQRLWPDAPAPLPELEAYLLSPQAQGEVDACEREERYPRAVMDALHARGLARLLANAPGEDSLLTSYNFALLNAMTARHAGAGVAITVGVNALALLPAYVAASDEQLAEIFARVRGGALSAMLLTEAAHGSSLLRVETRAERGVLEGDAFQPVEADAPCTHYRVTGEKHTINGGHEHDLMFTLVRTRAAASGVGKLQALADLSFLWIDRQDGVQGLHRWRTLPARSADISGVSFDQVVVGAERLLAGEGEGFSLVRKTLTLSRGGIAPLASGTMSRACELVRAYALRREVTGEPIATLGGIGEHLLHVEALDRAVAAVTLRAIAAMNAVGRGAGYLTAIAKLMACSLAEEGVDEGARVLGGRSLLEELPYSRLCRDVRLYGIFDGTRHVMLTELEARLADDVYRWRSGEAPVDTLAEARGIYGAAPRPFLEAAREGGAPLVLSLPEHLAILAALPGVDAGPLPRVAEALYALVAGLFGAQAWKEDQANRFHAAETLGLLETVAALLELNDPQRRRALGAGDLPPEEAAWCRYACTWLGARAASRVRFLASRCGLGSGVEAIETQLLAGHVELRRELLARVAQP